MNAPASTFGIMLPSTDQFGHGVGDVAGAAARAEELGYESVWVGDHLAYSVPILESVVALATAGARTSSVRLGFGVALPALREPAWFAKQVSSLQFVTGNRVILGVGAGGEFADEWAGARSSVKRRGARTDEILNALPALVTGRAARMPDHDGTPYDIPALHPHGLMPPVWIGGRSDAALRRAAQYAEGYLGLWLDPGRIRQSIATMRRFADEVGRVDTPHGGVTVLVSIDDDPAKARKYAAGFVEATYKTSFDRVERYIAHGTAEMVLAKLGALREAGAALIVALPATEHPVEQYEPLCSVRDALAA